MQKKQVAVIDVGSSKISVIIGERGVNKTFLIKARKDYAYDGFEGGEFGDMEGFENGEIGDMEGFEDGEGGPDGMEPAGGENGQEGEPEAPTEEGGVE